MKCILCGATMKLDCNGKMNYWKCWCSIDDDVYVLGAEAEE